MFFDRYEKLCRDYKKTPTGVAVELGIGRGTVSYWKSGNTPKQDILIKIASYFNVSVDYLLEKTDVQTPNGGAISDIDIKFALFGEKADKIPDEKLQEVKNFAKYIMDTYNNE